MILILAASGFCASAFFVILSPCMHSNSPALFAAVALPAHDPCSQNRKCQACSVHQSLSGDPHALLVLHTPLTRLAVMARTTQ